MPKTIPKHQHMTYIIQVKSVVLYCRNSLDILIIGLVLSRKDLVFKLSNLTNYFSQYVIWYIYYNTIKE